MAAWVRVIDHGTDGEMWDTRAFSFAFEEENGRIRARIPKWECTITADPKRIYKVSNAKVVEHTLKLFCLHITIIANFLSSHASIALMHFQCYKKLN